MYLKILLNIIAILTFVIIQLFFISGLPLWLDRINLILIILLFVLVSNGFNTALRLGIGTGFLLDIFSFYSFGVYLIVIIITLCILNYLLESFFTNRSIYTFLALGIFAIISHELLINFLRLVYSFFSGDIVVFIFTKDFYIDILSQLIVNSIVVVILFYLFNLISYRLKPIFLWKR